jgi:hypothetical protein
MPRRPDPPPEWLARPGVKILGLAPGSAAAAPAPRTGNKYHARITEYDGIKYDSKAEAKYAEGLDLAVRAGAIRGWIRQVRFLLGPARISYRCDFLMFGADGVAVAVDVKGVVTERFAIIKRLWSVHGPCDLQVVCKGEAEVIRGGGGTGS